MKELIINNMEYVIMFLTMGITWFLGWLTKKNKKLSNKLIPYQNIIVGVIATLIYWWATGDFSMVVASSSPVATLLYDAKHTSNKLKVETLEVVDEEESELLEDRDDE